jgi:hyperosmotically inducible protein
MDPRCASQAVRIAVVAVASALALGAAGCDQSGPAEKMGAEAGRTLDRAAEKMGQAADAAGKAVEGAGAAVKEHAADAGLSAKVKSAVIAEAGPSGLGIDVSAAGGVVTLQGTVDTPEARERVVRAASGVDGVRSVDNRLVVARGS